MREVTVDVSGWIIRDAANNLTGATYDFTVNITGFPANTTLTGAHIHAAPAGSNEMQCSVRTVAREA